MTHYSPTRTMRNILHRFWRRRRASLGRLTIAVQCVELQQPISLSKWRPGNRDYLGDLIWWGFWDADGWLWDLQEHPGLEHTHWLPATAQVLPARCCPPEVES